MQFKEPIICVRLRLRQQHDVKMLDCGPKVLCLRSLPPAALAHMSCGKDLDRFAESERVALDRVAGIDSNT